jgi:hypothetical protein
MSYPFATTIAITTSTAGASTDYTSVQNRFIHAIRYVSTDTASTADLTVTTEDTGFSILATTNMATDVDVTWYPRAVANTVTGGASGIAQELIPVSGERVKIVMAQGGNEKSGTAYVVFS